jgi:predicted kinase
MVTLVLIRGLPGSGKTSFAHLLRMPVCSADDNMVDADGRYAFNSARLEFCHQRCQLDTAGLLANGENVAVANTFSQHWEMKPYLEMAKKAGARLHVVDLFDGGLTDVELVARNIHGVPHLTISQMRARWQR